jgi:carbamate kinase
VLVAAGWRVAVTHGNGPQVGFILRRSELVGETDSIPTLPLDLAVADSQGGVGYIIANSLTNALAERGLPDRVAGLLTHTLVDPADPAFSQPSKPIGGTYAAAQAALHQTRDGWSMVEEAGRGYRRVVASPSPRRIVEAAAIKALLEAGFVVVAGGGGGIPVVETSPGVYRGIDAVVDKDFTSSLLAAELGVPYFVICTAVERVAVHFRQPGERWLDRLTVSEARAYLAAGEFPAGSMGPKIRAALDFLDLGGREVIITSETHLEAALAHPSSAPTWSPTTGEPALHPQSWPTDLTLLRANGSGRPQANAAQKSAFKFG